MKQTITLLLACLTFLNQEVVCKDNRVYPIVIDCTDSLAYSIPQESYGELKMDVSTGVFETPTKNYPYLQVAAQTSVEQSKILYTTNLLNCDAYYNIYLVTVPADDTDQYLPHWMQVRYSEWDSKDNKLSSATNFINPDPITADSSIDNADIILRMPKSEHCYVSNGTGVDTLLIQSAYKPKSPFVQMSVESFGPSSNTYREVIYTRTLTLHKIILIPFATAEEAAQQTGVIPETFDQPQPTNGLYYDFHDDGTCEVVAGPVKPAGGIVLDEAVEHKGQTYRLTAVGDFAFCNSRITSLTIPANIQKVGACAFTNCKLLKAITVTSDGPIPSDAGIFTGTTNVESLTLDAPYIPNTFKDFSNLQTVTFGRHVRVIGNSAFERCTSLRDIHFNEELDSIEGTAFKQCQSVDSLSFGPNLKYIGDAAFMWCGKLKAVNVRATTPPTLGSNVFYISGPGPKLYIPENCSIYYRAAKGWRDFPVVLAPDYSSIEERKPYPTITIGRIWETRYSLEGGKKQNIRYIVDDLHVIDGKLYTSVVARERTFSSSSSILRSSISDNRADTLFFRQEGDRVYYLPQDGSPEVTLFDFGLKLGDEFQTAGGERLHVTETDFFSQYESCFAHLRDSISPKTLRLVSESGREEVWIEGMGSAEWGIVSPTIVEKLKCAASRPLLATTANLYYKGEVGNIQNGMFDINEENYKLVHFISKSPTSSASEYNKLHFAFSADTLCIKGVIPMHSVDWVSCFECIVTENNTIAYDIWTYNIIPITGMYNIQIDLKVPGFKAGTYTIWDTEGAKTYVCPGKQKESYIPFVEKGKQWHVLGFCMGPYKSVTDYFFRGNEEVSIGEHTYLPLYTGDKGAFYGVDNENKQLQGLFREEDRRVYLYDTTTEREYCVYDFTLEVGDTFDIGWGNEADRCVVTNVGEMNIRGLKLKTITFSSISPAMGGSELLHDNHTWVEGIGDLSGPCAGWIPNMYSSSWSHCVAYMVSYNNYRCFPFSFSDFWGSSNWVIGHDLIPGEALTWKEYEEKIPGEALTWKEYEEKYQGKPLLDYEITGGRLHVKGYMWLQRCEAYYIYCKLSPTEEHWKTYKITLQDEVMGEETDCISTPHAVDLYFDIPFLQYDNNCNFVYEDQDGEHFVVNRDKYQPFVEEGKTWKVGLFWGSDKASEVEIYRMEGDTLVGDIACKRWIRQTMNYENRRTEYIGAVYEQGRRVYEFLPGRSEAVLLYDFATPVGEWVDVYDANLYSMVKCYIEKRDTVSTDGYLLRRTTAWSYPNDDTDVIYKTIWTEGIGNNKRPNYNTDSENPGDYHYLIACMTGTDVPLYKSPVLFEDISEYWMLQDRGEMGDGEARKEQIDFTHVVKTRPKAPARYANGVSLLWGEYDDSELSIAFGGMSGRYAISLQNDDEPQARYAATHETQNLQAIDINLTDYPEGRYTIAVENDEESYTAHFVLPLDGNGIESMRLGDNEKTSSVAVYDLLGRRIPMPRKGVYLRGRQKIVK